MRIKSNTYRLAELKSVIEEGMKQIDKAIALHKEMYDILDLADKKEIDDNYMSSLKQQIEKLEENKNERQFNLQLVDDLLQRAKAHENDEFNEIDAVITLCLHLFTDIKIENEEETSEEVK